MAECERPNKHRNPKCRRRIAKAKRTLRRVAKRRDKRLSIRMEERETLLANQAMLDELKAYAEAEAIWQSQWEEDYWRSVDEEHWNLYYSSDSLWGDVQDGY